MPRPLTKLYAQVRTRDRRVSIRIPMSAVTPDVDATLEEIARLITSLFKRGTRSRLTVAASTGESTSNG